MKLLQDNIDSCIFLFFQKNCDPQAFWLAFQHLRQERVERPLSILTKSMASMLYETQVYFIKTKIHLN